MEPLQWILITTAITLIFAVYGANVMQVATDEAIANTAKFEARRVASVINLMATAPDGTTYRFDISAAKCRLTVTESFVKMKVTYLSTDLTETYGLIKTPVRVMASGEFDCKDTRTLKIEKKSGVITVGRG